MFAFSIADETFDFQILKKTLKLKKTVCYFVIRMTENEINRGLSNELYFTGPQLQGG